MSSNKSLAPEKIAHVFAALGDPPRLKLVAVLCAGGAFSIAEAQHALARIGQQWERRLDRLKALVEGD